MFPAKVIAQNIAVKVANVNADNIKANKANLPIFIWLVKYPASIMVNPAATTNTDKYFNESNDFLKSIENGATANVTPAINKDNIGANIKAFNKILLFANIPANNNTTPDIATNIPKFFPTPNDSLIFFELRK